MAEACRFPAVRRERLRAAVIVPGSLTGASGCLLAGRTLEGVWNAIGHAAAIAAGLPGRCSAASTSRGACTAPGTHLCICPNTNLPDTFGKHGASAEVTAAVPGEHTSAGLIHIAGRRCTGCRGRRAALAASRTRLSGLKPRNPSPVHTPVKIAPQSAVFSECKRLQAPWMTRSTDFGRQQPPQAG
jgi:hypothetical protein